MRWMMIGLGLFVGSYGTVTYLSPALAPVSLVFLVLFALPSCLALVRFSRRGWLILLLLAVFAYLIETIGILTGFPYSRFVYTELIGPKIAGITPWGLPFAFVPLVIGAMTLSGGFSALWQKIFVAVGVLLLADLVLDPGAVALGIWVWERDGLYYGVPLVNFVGWVFSGLVASGLFIYFEKSPLPPQAAISLYLTLCFWTGVAFWLGLWIPFGLGLAVSVGTYWGADMGSR